MASGVSSSGTPAAGVEKRDFTALFRGGRWETFILRQEGRAGNGGNLSPAFWPRGNGIPARSQLLRVRRPGPFNGRAGLLLSSVLVSAAPGRVHRPYLRGGRVCGLPLPERGLRPNAAGFRSCRDHKKGEKALHG